MCQIQIYYMHIDTICICMWNTDATLIFPLEHTSGPETNVCEGERRGAVSASSQNLHRCHYHPAKQPAVCPFICLCAICLRISLWFDAAALNCFNFPRHGITPLPSFLSLSPSLPLSPFISSMSVQNLPDRSCFIMYEFWQDRLSWMR